MKLMLIFVDADRAADVERLLDASDVPGYSEFPGVLGKGATGRKFGNRAFPGSSTLYFVALLGEGACGGLCDRLEALRTERGPEEGLRVYVLEATEVI
jgi:hypothetical protein